MAHVKFQVHVAYWDFHNSAELIFKRQQPNCVSASIKQTSDAKLRVDRKPQIFKLIIDA